MNATSKSTTCVSLALTMFSMLFGYLVIQQFNWKSSCAVKTTTLILNSDCGSSDIWKQQYMSSIFMLQSLKTVASVQFIQSVKKAPLYMYMHKNFSLTAITFLKHSVPCTHYTCSQCFHGIITSIYTTENVNSAIKIGSNTHIYVNFNKCFKDSMKILISS